MRGVNTCEFDDRLSEEGEIKKGNQVCTVNAACFESPQGGGSGGWIFGKTYTVNSV